MDIVATGWGANDVVWYMNPIVVIDKSSIKLLTNYELFQNYPNPFNPSTIIQYSLPKPEQVKIEIYNNLGQIIETLLNKLLQAGNYELIFNTENLPSGVYFYRIQAGEFQDVKKMILLK